MPLTQIFLHSRQSKVPRLLASERNVDIHARGLRNIWLRENMNE